VTYQPTIAVINLTSGEINITSTPEELTRAYLGGRGMNMAYLRHTLRAYGGDPRDIDPFDPRNPLILGAGLFRHHRAQRGALQRLGAFARERDSRGLKLRRFFRSGNAQSGT